MKIIYGRRSRKYLSLLECLPVKYQICEQASNTLSHTNRAKHNTESSAIARLRAIFGVGGWLTPKIYSGKTHDFTKLSMGLSCLRHASAKVLCLKMICTQTAC